mgnify:CR=1 FL=1
MEPRGDANCEQVCAVASGGAACAADAAEDLASGGGAAKDAEEVLALRLCALTGEFYRANAIVLADATVAVAGLGAVARGYGCGWLANRLRTWGFARRGWGV